MTGTVQERFEAKVIRTDGCWEWTAGKFSTGYGAFKLSGRLQKAHRIAYELYVGKIPDGLCVCHRCDNPGCVRPDHLFLGTHADNARDKIDKGRGNQPLGERNGQAKLTEAQVVAIRSRYAAGERQCDLAKECVVGHASIWRIVRRVTWASV